MSSSIFSFELVGRAMRLPGREKGWIATLVLACTAVVIVAPALLRPFVARENAFTVANRAASAETRAIFFGSSHIANGVKPSKFAVPIISFNLEGADYSSLYAVAHQHIEKLSGVDVAVIELAPLSLVGNAFSKYGGDYRDPFDLGFDVSALNVGPELKENIESEIRRYRSYFWPLFDYRKLTPRNILMRLPTENLEPGFRPKERHVDLTVDGRRRAEANYGKPINQGNVARNKAAFMSLVHLLNDRKVKIIFLWTPKYKSFLAARPENGIHLINEMVDEANAAIGKDVIQEWDDETVPELEDSDFADSDHLREKGADKYSAMLNQRIMLLLD